MPSHTDCVYTFSPVWIIVWLIRLYCLLKTVNILSHWWHWYGLSPVCFLICLIGWLLCENTLSHGRHWYGISSVWILTCLIKITFMLKCLGSLDALVRSLSGVNPHMFYKSAILWEFPVTLPTLTWFLSSLYPHMAYKSSIIWECLVTLAALIWFSPSLNHHGL